MSTPKQSSKYLILAIITAFLLSGSLAYAAPIEGPRYFVKTDSPFWQKSFGVRNVFENGFTSDLSGIQLTLARIFGVEVEPVQQFHILPEEKKEALRVKPVEQVPWGVKLIYNDQAITATSGGAGVNVAVLDTGVLKAHSDLKNRVRQCKDFTHARTPLKDGACDDKNGHGTHVSGIILADGGADKLGLYGVAPDANLFAYKVCGNDGSCWADDIAYAIKTAADEKANVVNLSLGSDIESFLINEAIDYAVSKDILVVAAAGNDGPYPASIDYPAANADIMAVAAIDSDFGVPEWSSQGINSTTLAYVIEKKDMELGAPGVNVESAWKNGGYAILSGTSMASPHVAGLAAKIWQSPAEGSRAKATRELIHRLAKDIWILGDDDATGFGLPQLK